MTHADPIRRPRDAVDVAIRAVLLRDGAERRREAARLVELLRKAQRAYADDLVFAASRDG